MIWARILKGTPLVASVAMACVLLAGCGVPSIHPFYTKADLVAEPAIVGNWAVKGEKQTIWKFFQKPATKGYTLVMLDNGTALRFDAHLIRLGGTLFMDTCLADDGLESSQLANAYAGSHLFAAHVPWKVDVKGDDLTVACMDSDKLEKALSDKSVAVAHEWQERDEDADPATLILTAPTADLQEFLLKSGAKVFTDEPQELHRKHLASRKHRHLKADG